MDKKKILLIGAGFIGTNFYKLFHDEYDIVILDSYDYASTLVNGLWDMDSPLSYRCDITNLQHLLQTVKEISPDYIINFAAKSHVDRSIHDYESFLETNTFGVENILRVITGTKTRLLQFSTDEVYGDTPVDSLEESKETDTLHPSSPYSASKAAADMVVSAYVRTHGTDVVTVRPTNNYGPYQYPEKLIPFLIKRLAEGKTLPIYGDGSNTREWLYVDDCCKAVELVLREGVSGEIYNIGSGYDNRASNVFIATHLQGSNDNLEYVTDRPGHDRRYAVDSTKIHDLGWHHTINIDEGLEKTKDWYFRNMDVIKQMKANPHIK